MSLVAASALGVFMGCWTGEDSRGLPCESNVECGIGLECSNGYCGGVAAESLCGNGVLDPDEDCDDGELNASDGACRPDCTPQSCGDGVQGPSEMCDLGEQNSDTGACKTDCTPEICGDTLVGPSEACDDGNLIPNDGCSPTCTLESCGNGVLDPGEHCDDGGESATCDDDCTAVECGDLNVNETAGEGCDNDAVDDRECMANCTVPLLWDDMEPSSPELPWTEDLNGDAMQIASWERTNRGPLGTRVWDSGLPAGSPGDVRLITPDIDLGELAGETIRLRFDHAHVFKDCMGSLVQYEGGVLEVSVDGGAYEIVTPDGGYTGTIGLAPACDNPLEGQEGFTLDATPTPITVDLSAYAGSVINIGFRVGWDCMNCGESQTGRGWFIDNVVVAIE